LHGVISRRLNITNHSQGRFQWLRGLRRWSTTDHSSREVLPTVVRRCVLSRNLKNEKAMARIGPQRSRKKSYSCGNMKYSLHVYRSINLHVHFILPTPFVRPDQVFLHFITLVLYWKRYKLENSLVKFPSLLFTNVSTRRALNAKNQVPHSYKTKGKIMVFYIFKFLDRPGESKANPKRRKW